MSESETNNTLNKPSKESLGELVFPENLIERSQLGEFGMVTLVAHRARKLALGAEATLALPYNTKEPIAAMLEMSDGTVTFDEVKEDYLTTTTDNIVTQSFYGSMRSEDDQYTQYMQSQTTDEEIGEERLMALFENFND